jgi:hypothetical protein
MSETTAMNGFGNLRVSEFLWWKNLLNFTKKTNLTKYI